MPWLTIFGIVCLGAVLVILYCYIQIWMAQKRIAKKHLAIELLKTLKRMKEKNKSSR